MSPTTNAEVTILGCGPVGALLANLLAARGVHCVVLDRARDVYELPRAVAMDDEVLRALQSVGLAEPYAQQVTELCGMDLLRRDRRLLRRVSLANEPESLGHPLLTLFHQPTLERLLRSGFERFGDLLDLRLGAEVTEIRDLGHRLELDVSALDSPDRTTLSTSYLLGCDGARSLVRKSFGVGQRDLGLHQPWVVVDALMKRPRVRSGYAEQICDPARPATFIPTPEPRLRWEFMLLPGDDPEEMVQPQTLAELIRPWAAPEDYEVERAVVYTFHALVAEHWRIGGEGRALLLGDAAHQMPPFLGQGMCAGFRDAVNLAWKLDMILHHGADPSLLATYESERRPHVEEVIRIAVRIGKLIQSPSRVRSFLANRFMVIAERLGLQTPIRSMKSVPIGPGFVSPQHGPRESDRIPFPQPNVDVGEGRARRLDDLLGHDFALLTRETRQEADADEPPIRRLAASADGPCPIRSWLDEHRCDSVLLRPDRQPFGIYRGLDARPAAVTADLASALTRPS